MVALAVRRGSGSLVLAVRVIFNEYTLGSDKAFGGGQEFFVEYSPGFAISFSALLDFPVNLKPFCFGSLSREIASAG